MLLGVNREGWVSDDLRYWGFISYSHADQAIARRIHRKLERFRLPVALAGVEGRFGALPKRLFPVFLDREELAGASELAPELESALSQSRCLIVICSPHAARSPWVGKEIEFFRQRFPDRPVLAVIAKGEPKASQSEEECFPPSLVQRTESGDGECVEPLAVDVRPGKDGRVAHLKLAAGMLGISFDGLRQRDLQARLRRQTALVIAGFGLAAAMLGLALFAFEARQDARHQQAEAEGLIEFMLGDLRGRLDAVGKLSLLDVVVSRAIQYFDGVDPEDKSDDSLLTQAVAYRQIGSIRTRQSQYEAAAEILKRAWDINAALVNKDPQNPRWRQQKAKAESRIADLYTEQGDFAQAQLWNTRQVETLKTGELAGELSMALASAVANLASTAMYTEEYDNARNWSDEAMALMRVEVENDPQSLEKLHALKNIYGFRYLIEYNTGESEQAFEMAKQDVAVGRRMLEVEPGNANTKLLLLNGLINQLASRRALGEVAAVDPLVQEIRTLSEFLYATDPENSRVVQLRILSLSYLSIVYLEADAPMQALEINTQCVQMAKEIYARRSDSLFNTRNLMSCLVREAQSAWIAGEPRLRVEQLDEAVALGKASGMSDTQVRYFMLEAALTGQYFMRNTSDEIRFKAIAEQMFMQTQEAQVTLEAGHRFRYEALNGDLERAREIARTLSVHQRRNELVEALCEELEICAANSPDLPAE